MAAVLPCLKFGMPPIGFGTYELIGEECATAVRTALSMGYRLLDTAAGYHNEEYVGEGISSSGVAREELFVVVKIGLRTMHTEAAVRAGILTSLEKLGIAYADCVLMHWPAASGLKPEDAAENAAARARCWQVMRELQDEDKIRYRAVSNFLPRHFAALKGCHEDVVGVNSDSNNQQTLDTSATPFRGPILNQVELHPLCVQREVEAYCRTQHGMIMQQYSPLAQMNAQLFEHPGLVAVHQRYFSAGRQGNVEGAEGYNHFFYSLADIVIMWGLAQGYCSLVRSRTVVHQQANLDAAKDYFASANRQSAETNGEGATQTGSNGRPLLTAKQLEVIHDLRQHMRVEDAEDVHFFWYSTVVL